MILTFVGEVGWVGGKVTSRFRSHSFSPFLPGTILLK